MKFFIKEEDVDEFDDTILLVYDLSILYMHILKLNKFARKADNAMHTF